MWKCSKKKANQELRIYCTRSRGVLVWIEQLITSLMWKNFEIQQGELFSLKQMSEQDVWCVPGPSCLGGYESHESLGGPQAKGPGRMGVYIPFFQIGPTFRDH